MKYFLNKGFITQKVGDKTTIYSGEDSILYTLNETASYMLNGIKLGWEGQKIIEKIVKIYDVKQEKAELDFKDFILDLRKARILEMVK